MGRIADERRSKLMGLNVLSDMAAIDLRRSRNISASIESIEDGSIEWRYEGAVEFLWIDFPLLKRRIKEKRRFFLLLLLLLLEVVDMAGDVMLVMMVWRVLMFVVEGGRGGR